MFRFWRCLVDYNNGATYGQVLKAYFSEKSKKTLVEHIKISNSLNFFKSHFFFIYLFLLTTTKIEKKKNKTKLADMRSHGSNEQIIERSILFINDFFKMVFVRYKVKLASLYNIDQIHYFQSCLCQLKMMFRQHGWSSSTCSDRACFLLSIETGIHQKAN
ncbi:hypothetical protein BpHYR1_014784 [Brachionus plicatilis]|uniref:Uncharacterized protein n=1 Tax=Brachionus plicatilis TaxID=10195 RepID=A0A3M7RWG5_BRAPC|nr:hypothetical protein BpHYR1_014784 [Brachionus plicatilis]